MQRLILASGSPRRSELLARIGIPFDVMVSGIEEVREADMKAHDYARAMSRNKAMDIVDKQLERLSGGHDMVCLAERNRLVLACDTVVAREEHILGKPEDRTDAARMLRLLSGSWHEVLTGMTLVRIGSGEMQSGIVTTRVKFRALSENLIARYLGTGEPFDKAGAYGVQGYGSLLVERIDGDYYNVMGLPLQRLSEMLEEMGTGPFEWLA